MANSLSMVLGRRHTLRNNTQRIFYLREWRRCYGRCSHETRLKPYSVRHDFPATIYRDNNRDSGLQSRIVVSVDNDEALGTLTPENFVQYIELTFEMDEVNNKLIVYGIPAWWMDYLPRWASGRDYSDRPRDIVLSCKFKVIENENEGCLLSGQLDQTKDLFKLSGSTGRLYHVWSLLKDQEKFKSSNTALPTFLPNRGNIDSSQSDYSPTTEFPTPNSPGLSGFGFNMDEEIPSRSSQQSIGLKKKMTMIHISITYDGKWKKNEQGGGYTWSCGANAKHEAILVDGNNLTLEVVAKETCETLGLNGLGTELKFSYLPAMGSCYACPIYVLNSRSLGTYLSFGDFGTRPMLHVENVKSVDQ